MPLPGLDHLPASHQTASRPTYLSSQKKLEGQKFQPWTRILLYMIVQVQDTRRNASSALAVGVISSGSQAGQSGLESG
jgi:hypothetical protein